MSTATIDLKFNAKDGIPTLENLIQKLKEIKAETGKGISVKVNVKEALAEQDKILKNKKQESEVDNQLIMNVKAKYDLYKEEDNFRKKSLKEYKDLQNSYSRQEKDFNSQRLKDIKEGNNLSVIMNKQQESTLNIINSQQVGLRRNSDLLKLNVQYANEEAKGLEKVRKKQEKIQAIVNKQTMNTGNFTQDRFNSLLGISKSSTIQDMSKYYSGLEKTSALKESKDLLTIINKQVSEAELKFKRQEITNVELNREYKNAIKYLKDMEGQEVRLNQIKTKKWEIDKRALTEIDNQRVASEKMHSKVMSNIQAEANAMNKKFNVQKKMAEQYSKYGDINTAHAQAIKINQAKNIKSATGYINEPPILPPSPTPKSGGMLNIGEYMARYAGAYAAFNIGKASLVELYDFEKAITQIGIAGEMSQTQIQSLRYEYGNLATESGISSKEIAMAGETIIKTGQSLSDTNLILKEAIKLSKATGDSLSYTAESLSKILLTLQISAEHVTDVTNMMMSVANKTPASMQSLQEGLKQSNAGFANFAESTTKSGEALEEYKLKLIQTELAMMGGLAQLGRKGEQTGTSIRQLSIKMSTMEKTATNLFNAEMNLKNIFVEVDKVSGKLNVTNGETANSFALTAEMLSNLANEDAPKAIELLSKLYSNGQLSMTTLNKMFTIQHAPYLTQVLTQINGDMDEYNKKMTTGSTVTQAYDQSMGSWANQFDRMRQGLSMSNVLISDFVNILGGTVLKPIADFGEGLSKIYTGSQILNTTIKSLISTLIATVGAWKAYSISMSFVKGMQEAFVVNTLASTSAVVSETVAIEGATVATKGFGLALKTVAPFVAIFAGFEIFNFIMESMKKEEEQALKSADANNAFAKSLSDTFKNIKDYRGQIKETQDATNNLRAESLFKDWNNISDVVDKVIGKFDKLKASQEAINKLTILYANKQDYFANIPKLRGERPAEAAIVAGQPIKYNDTNMNEQDLRDRLGSKRLELTSLYNQYLETGKGQEKINALLKNSGIVLRDVQAYYTSMAKAQEEYTKQTEEATKQTLIFESSVKDLLSIQAQNIKEFKFELIGDAINKSNIKNVQEFTETLTNFGLGSYVTRLGNVKDAFSRIVTESGKVDVLKNNLLPLVSGLSTIDNIIASTNKNIELAKGIEGQEQRVKEQKELVSLLEQQKERMIKNALIEKTHVGIREKVSQSYQTELFNLQKVGKGKWEQLQIDKKTLEFNTKLQEELDKNKLDSLKTTINSEFVKYGEKGVKSSYSEKELEAKLEELNSKAGKLTPDEEKAQKLILEYKNAQNQAEANKIKAQIQSLQYSIQEKEMLKERTRIYDEFNSLTLNNSQIEHNISQRAFEDWVELAKDKNKSIEAEIAYTKYLLQLNKERKSIVEDMNKFQENRNSVQNIGNQYKILQSTTEKEKIGLQYTITKNNTLSEIASLNNKINLTTTSAIDKETMIIQIEQKKFDLVNAYYDMLRKIYDLKEKTKKATYDIDSEKINRGRLRTNSYYSNPSEDFKNRKSDIDREREFLKTQKKDIENSKLPTLEKEALIKENELATEKNITAEAQRQYDIHKQSFENRVALFNTISQTIDKISKGEFSSTPSYDLTKTFEKMADSTEKGHGLFGKANLNGKDYAQISNFAITQFSNVWGTINSKHIESINNEITMLDMRKQLATSDEERQRIDKEILDKKIQAIRLESQTKQQQSIMGGITGGIGTMAAGGFNPVSIGLGVLQMGMGIFGASEEKKKAKIQEKQLREQERLRVETERQTKLLEQQKAFMQTWLKNSFSGIVYGLEKAFKKDKYGFNWTSSLTGVTYSSTADSYEKFTNLLNDAKNKPSESADEIRKTAEKYGIQLLDDISMSRYDFNRMSQADQNKVSGNYDAINYYTQLYADMLKEDTKYTEQKKIIYQNYFDWELDAALDADNKETGFYTKGSWKKREDIMNQFVENAKTGANTIAKYMGDYVTSSIISAWTRNRTSLNIILTDIENNVTKLSDYMSENIGLNLTDMFKTDEISPDIDELNYQRVTPLESKPFNSFLSPLIDDFKSLSEEQNTINSQAAGLVNTWIILGGAVSDVLSMLPQFSKDLYNAISGSLEQTSFVDRFNTIGEALSSSIIEKLKKNLMDTSLKNTFSTLNDEITKIMNGGDTSITDIVSLSSRIAQASASMQASSDKTKAMLDLLKLDNNIEYKSAQNNIEYSSGSQSTINNSYNIVVNQDIGSILNMDKTDRTIIAQQLVEANITAIEGRIGKIGSK